MTIPFPTAGMYTREDLKTMEGSSPVFEATDCCYITFCLQSYSLIQAQTQYHGVYVYGFLGVLLFGWLDFFLTSSKSSITDLFLSSEEAGLERLHCLSVEARW